MAACQSPRQALTPLLVWAESPRQASIYMLDSDESPRQACTILLWSAESPRQASTRVVSAEVYAAFVEPDPDYLRTIPNGFRAPVESPRQAITTLDWVDESPRQALTILEV